MESPWESRDIEIGMANEDDNKEFEPIENSSLSLAARNQELTTVQMDIERADQEDKAQRQEALQVIAQLDPLTKTA